MNILNPVMIKINITLKGFTTIQNSVHDSVNLFFLLDPSGGYIGSPL